MKKMHSSFRSRNINIFKTHTKRIISLSLIAFLLISLSYLAFIFYMNRHNDTISNQQAINKTNSILQKQLSLQLSIFVNNMDFIRYLRSGTITRNKNHLQMKWAFAKLNRDLIKGVEIFNSYEILYYDGEKNKFFTTLKLCYLGDVLNETLGNCSDFITIYLNKDAYINELKKISPVDFTTNNGDYNYSFQPFSNTFGVFHTQNYSRKNNITLYLKHNDQPMLIGSIYFLVLFFILGFIFSHRALNRIINNYLINPLKYLYDGYNKANSNLKEQPHFLLEFNELIHVINEYNSRTINSKIETLSEDIAHKLNNPLNGIVAIMPKIMSECKAKAELDLLEKYIKTIHGLTKDILNNFRVSTKSQEYDDISDSRFVIAEYFIDRIINDYQIQHPKCQYKIEHNSISWIYISPIEFQDSILNLLNNAYESLNGRSVKNIHVKLHDLTSILKIEIIDTGCGIPMNELNNVMSGKSLKPTGNGIGLTSAIKYFQKLNGRLNISSQENCGTTIEVKIQKHEIPVFLTETILYEDLSTFIVISHNVEMIVKLQKLLVNIDNNKFYFTDLNEYDLFKQNKPHKNIVAIVDDSLYISLINKYSNVLVEFKHIYLVIYDQLTIDTQKTLSSRNHDKSLIWANFDKINLENIIDLAS
ncbi:sensor histidine kinase [Cysteiniphilum halobium]|uniref:sensor histidine kinase n=1 Tax=Cysteiniphilum halobium TaxID=2219059 RepID=UPI000E64F39C|nr:HAMP domain-containing sensor histidine kinase [Cysteiniphilum halobium]